MKLSINVENSAGVKLGPGPIITATQWSNVRRLNLAGAFATTVPAGESRLAYATAKRVLAAWGSRTGERPMYLGAGIIDSQSLVVGADGSSVAIAGDDLLRELVSRTVGFLALRDLQVRTPDTMLHEAIPDSGPSVWTPLVAPFALTLAAGDYWYVGDADPFSILRLVIGATPNAVEATLALDYWNGADWTALDPEDFTYTAAATLRQSGDVEYERLLDWSLSEVNGISAYWLRIQATAALTPAVTITSVEVVEELPVADALDRIMVYAPTGWALDTINGYASTGATVYAKFAGESVLAALIMVATAIGENFILGAGRRVLWLRDDVRSSGLRAVAHVDPIAAEGNANIVLLKDLERVEDSYDLITRIYPYGGGNSRNRLTLADADWTPPAGYTLNKTANYIESVAGVAAWGRFERSLAWSEIAPIHNTVADGQMAANMLAQAAYEELSRSDAPHMAYRATVVGQRPDRPLLPGHTVEVDYHEWRDGYHAININRQTLWILEVEEALGPDGLQATGLLLATVDRWPTAEGQVGASSMDEGRIYEAHAQGTMAYSVAGPYVRRIDATHPAEFTCRIGREVTALEYARLRFRSAPLTSSVKSVAGQTTTSDAGGGVTISSEAGGGVTVSSAAGGSTVGTVIPESSVSDSGPPSFSPGSPYSTSSGSHNHSGGTERADGVMHYHEISSDGSHTHGIDANHDHSIVHNHSVSLPDHTHDVTLVDHDHSIELPEHSHTLIPNVVTTYGLYADTQYPVRLSVSVDGVDVTTAIGGPWATAGAAVEVEADITAYLRAAPGGLRQRHRILISCASGQGEIEAEVGSFVAVQAIKLVE